MNEKGAWNFIPPHQQLSPIFIALLIWKLFASPFRRMGIQLPANIMKNLLFKENYVDEVSANILLSRFCLRRSRNFIIHSARCSSKERNLCGENFQRDKLFKLETLKCRRWWESFAYISQVSFKFYETLSMDVRLMAVNRFDWRCFASAMWRWLGELLSCRTAMNSHQYFNSTSMGAGVWMACHAVAVMHL